jgi:lipoyl(octanoyl) transferase
MARDEALLRVAQVNHPILRTYSWSEPAVSLGYFTAFAEARELYPDPALVRRWTGGGLVAHFHDWTYSMIFPAPVPALNNSALYASIHGALINALRSSGIDAELVPAPDPTPNASCFARAVRFDVRFAGQKIAGAAIRRHRAGVLVQGSVQHVSVQPGFGQLLAEIWSGAVESYVPREEVAVLTDELIRTRYGTKEWTERF